MTIVQTTKSFARKILQGLIYGSKYDPKKYWTIRGLTYKRDFHSRFLENQKRLKKDRNISLVLTTVKESPIKPFNSLLDVGCGYGLYLKHFEDAFPSKKLFGCDISATQLRQARKFLGPNSKVELSESDGQRLPYPDKSIDITFTYGVCIHVEPDKIKDFLIEILRVTRMHYIFIESSGGANSFYYFAHNYEKIFESLGIDLRVVKELVPADNEQLYIADIP